MFRNILKFITYLIEDFKFLGFHGGFWFLTIPFIILIVCIEKNKCEKDKLNAAEDFYMEEVKELPLYPMEFKVNDNEKWQIGQVLKRMNYNSMDDLIKQMIKDII